ncbi:MAG: hypothetical protein AAGF94_07930 [Pseudomonadota bacterium]
MKYSHILLATLVGALPLVAHSASIRVTLEDPGVQTADLAGIGATNAAVETFNDVSTGNLNGYGSVLGIYSAGRVNLADQYGGADESQYLFVRSSPGSTLTLAETAR